MTPNKIRSILNIVFLILAAVAVITYFVTDFRTFLYVGATALFIKGVEFFIRFTN